MQSPTPTFRALLTCAALITATAAQADLRVTFDEGAPKDRFTVLNTGACALGQATVTLDLSTASGKLIFDVTGAGAGVQVFQPLEIVAGADALTTAPQVLDGQSSLRLDIATLPAGAAIGFTVDVDDTLGQREITVSGSEIAGARVTYVTATNSQSGVFSDQAVAIVPRAGCN